MAGDHRRVFLLAAEAAARLRLHYAHLVIAKAEQHFQRAVDVVGTLHRAIDRDAAVRLRNGDDAVRLDVELLLMAGPILAFHDEVGGGKSLREAAFFDRDGLEGRR